MLFLHLILPGTMLYHYPDYIIEFPHSFHMIEDGKYIAFDELEIHLGKLGCKSHKWVKNVRYLSISSLDK